MKLNLGCGSDVIDGYLNIDKNSTDPRVLKVDLEKLVDDYYSGKSSYEGVTNVKAHHVLEHVADLDKVMHFLYDVSVNGAIVDIVVPIANTLWAEANPDHKRTFNHRTFQYYTKEFITSDLGLFRGFTIVSQKVEREPNEWFDGIEWIVANLHVILKVVKE